MFLPKRNEAIAERCGALQGYIRFVGIVRALRAALQRENPLMKRESLLEKAIAGGIAYCRQEGILADFFEKLSQEEVNMLATEWNLEDAIRVAREETREKTWKEDRSIVFDIIKQAKSMDELKQLLEASFEEHDDHEG